MSRHAVLITDCHCANAALRQDMAWVNFAGTDNPGQPRIITGDIDGSGMLVDALVESRGLRWIILCQSSPRDKEAKRKRNGSPFGYFWYKQTLAIVSLDGHMLSLPKQLGFITDLTDVRKIDIPKALASRVKSGELTKNIANVIKRSQFRSLKFAPRAAGWLCGHEYVPFTSFSLSEIPDFGTRVWWVDNFGNCKTSVRVSEVSYEEGRTLRTNIGSFACISDLGDVPEGQPAAVVGSSGLEDDEFIELVVQGVGSGGAAKRYGLEVGSEFQVLSCD